MENKKTIVYFVRHAEPNNQNHDEMTRELTPKGMADRALVTAFLADKRVNAVLSSPYKRAVDTVSHYAKAYGMEVTTIEGFHEQRVDGWVNDFFAFVHRQWTDFDARLGGGETLREVQQRNMAALHGVLERYAGRTVVIGSHGTALSCIVNHYQPAFGEEDFLKILHLTPWVVRFTFDGAHCLGIEGYNLFDGTAEPLL